MNTNPKPFYGPSDDALDRAIRAVIEQPPPEDVKNRVLQTAAALGARDLSYLSRSARWIAQMAWTKKAWLAGASAMAVVLAALLLFSLQPPTIAWSQVAKAVRALPWIHMKMVGSIGESRETWLSFPRNISAMQDSDMVRYYDSQSGFLYDFDLKQKRLYRLSVDDHSNKELASLEGAFRAIFRGDAIPAEAFGLRLIKQRQRTVTEQGRPWILYELEFGDPDENDPNHRGAAVIRVDPQTKLPDLITVARGKQKTQTTLDYPAEGPADIYALGVPRDAPVEDRTPPPDLERIIKIVQQYRRDFDNYLVVAGGGDRQDPGVVHLVRCKGAKFRVDVGLGDTRQVASGEEMEKWWQGRGKEVLLEGSVLCDGPRVYQHDFAHPKPWWGRTIGVNRRGDGPDAVLGVRASNCDTVEYFVDLLAYPPVLDPHRGNAAHLVTTHFDPKGENGPPGSVRIEESMLTRRGGPVARRVYHKEEYWLQPKYGYALVKHVISECPEVDEDPQRNDKQIIWEYDGFRQTPHGAWYPTVARHKNAFQSENTGKPGGLEFHDQITYFYLDFTAKLPDELFTTAWHGDPLTGISFGTASKDLRGIKPPGGVPLFLGVRGKPVSVEGIERTRQRLEAVPVTDLEKWVVELERIIGKKLKDGLPSARQVCRTDFAIHMSLAFDGVKWNAERADELFKRAESLPPTAAKAWKEAFEAVLKKKIGQTDTTVDDGGPDWAVPLVLIPVYSFYDGQKYSSELAKKYLARLKQLTADDVSLWQDKIDQWGGTKLDAAVIIITLDYFFEKEKFQRDKFQAAIKAGRQ